MAAAPRPKNDWLLKLDATLALCWAGLDPEGEIGRLPPVVPEGELPPLPPLPPFEPDGLFCVPEPEPDAWPGLRFSDAWAARLMKDCMVLLPDAGL
jgi:hypothetical protein